MGKVLILLQILLFSTVSCGLAAQESCGFYLSNSKQRIIWGHLPVSVHLNNISTSRAVAIRAAMNTWGLFVEVKDSPADVEVVELSEWTSPANQQANTDIRWIGHLIASVTIKINLNHNPDLESLILHELGHSLGIAHSDHTAVMRPTLGDTEIRRKLGMYELNALKCGYKK